MKDGKSKMGNGRCCRAFSVLMCLCVGWAYAGIDIRCVTADGRPVSTNDVQVETGGETSAKRIDTAWCTLTALKDGPQMLRIEATLPLAGDETRLFDGLKELPLDCARTNELMMNGHFPMAAAWGGKGGAVALALAADGNDSYVDLRSEKGRLTISVRAALMRSGSQYSTSFNAFRFNPKYGARDAFAQYYQMYPRLFRRNEQVDPRIYGISAQYGSWRQANPEVCRFARAEWDWCIGAARTWGDPLDLEQPTGKRNVDYAWDEEVKYTDRRGKYRGYKNAELSQAMFDRVRDERLGYGPYCGVANAFYMMALANISNKIAERHPDSVGVGETFADHSYLYSTEVFTFPECSWGKELRRQLKILAEKSEISAVGFDVSRPRSVYRGARLAEMADVSWDRYGPCVVRGVGSAKLFDYMHTLKLGKASYRLGVVINSGGLGHLSDAFHTDTLMCESCPWDREKPFPLEHRLAVGEKGLTLWEGYSPRELDSDFYRRPEADRHRLINEMAHCAVHASFRTGASLPAGYLCEYTSIMARAFERMNDAGWKPVPGAMVAGEDWELARYGRYTRSYLAVNNLLRAARCAEIEVFPAEIESCRAGGRTSEGFIYAPFFGGTATNEVLDGREMVTFEVGPQLAGVLEAVGTMHGAGTLTAEWTDAVDGAVALTVRSGDFTGTIRLRDKFETYGREGEARRTMKPGDEVRTVYRDAWMEGLVAKMRTAADFTEIRHANDADSRDMAERVAFFLKKASGKDPQLRADGALVALTIGVGEMSVSASDRFALSARVRRFIDMLNRERFPAYRPPTPMPPDDRARYPFVRL